MGILAAVGGIASALIGAKSAKKSANAQVAASDKAAEAQIEAARIAAESARLGFDYLKDNPLVGQAQSAGGTAMGMRNALLGIGGSGADALAARQAFQEFQNSTGYQFRMDQGVDAITQSAAARGLLNSGAALKGLASYGQGLASAEYANYLNQLGGVQDVGLNAAYNVASQGQSAGATAAQAYLQAGQGQAMAYTNAGNALAQGATMQGQALIGGLGMAMSGLQDWYY